MSYYNEVINAENNDYTVILISLTVLILKFMSS